MRHTLLLFDIDGTLLDTGGVGLRAMQTVGERDFANQLDFQPIRFGGMLDPNIFAQAAQHGGLPDADTHHQQFHDAYLTELALELDRLNGRPTILPGVASLLDMLVEMPRMAMGIVTGNYTAAAPLKLRHAGIDQSRFHFSAFGDTAPTRAALVRHAMDRYTTAHGIPAVPERTIVIGDTPRDIDCAKDNGCVAFAVATGRSSADELRDHGADLVVEDLRDPGPLLALLHAF